MCWKAFLLFYLPLLHTRQTFFPLSYIIIIAPRVLLYLAFIWPIPMCDHISSCLKWLIDFFSLSRFSPSGPSSICSPVTLGVSSPDRVISHFAVLWDAECEQNDERNEPIGVEKYFSSWGGLMLMPALWDSKVKMKMYAVSDEKMMRHLLIPKTKCLLGMLSKLKSLPLTS